MSHGRQGMRTVWCMITNPPRRDFLPIYVSPRTQSYNTAGFGATVPYRCSGHLGAPAPCPASAERERERERAASIFPISIISCYDCAPECSHSVSQRPWPATRKFVLRLDDRIGNSRSRQSMHSVERAGAGVSYRCFLPWYRVSQQVSDLGWVDFDF